MSVDRRSAGRPVADELGDAGLDPQEAVVLEAAEQLAGEEGVAGCRRESLTEGRPERGTEMGAGEGGDVDLRQRVEVEDLPGPLGDAVEQPVEERRAGGRTARRQHRDGRRSGPAGDRRQRPQGEVVGPVEVLGHHEHAVRPGEGLDEVHAGLADGEAPVGAVGVAASRELLEQADPGRFVVRDAVEQAVGEGAGSPFELVGSRLEDLEAPCLGRLDRGASEMGLADAGLALEHQRGPVASGGGGDERVDGGERVDPPDGRRAGSHHHAVGRLVEVPPLGEALEPPSTSVDEAHRWCRPHQLTDDGRHQHLAARCTRPRCGRPR